MCCFIYLKKNIYIDIIVNKVVMKLVLSEELEELSA